MSAAAEEVALEQAVAAGLLDAERVEATRAALGPALPGALLDEVARALPEARGAELRALYARTCAAQAALGPTTTLAEEPELPPPAPEAPPRPPAAPEASPRPPAAKTRSSARVHLAKRTRSRRVPRASARDDGVIAEFGIDSSQPILPARETPPDSGPGAGLPLIIALDSSDAGGETTSAVEAPRAGNPERVGPYTIVSRLARGGMGVVYRARHPELGREVALKVLRHDRISPERIRRFRVEAEAAARLRHVGIVRIHEVSEGDGELFIAQELVEGGSLGARLLREGPLDSREAAALAEPLARALQHAHEQGVLHRDVKPDNVLLGSDGRPRLTDFGLARVQGNEQPLTQTGHMLGTLGYMAPEQARGEAKRADPRADVFGLGATLFAMLTAQVPYDGPTPAALRALLELPPPLASSRNPAVDPALDAICVRAMALRPADRYPSAEALADDLAAYLAGEAPALATRRPPWRTLLLAVGLLSFIGLGLLWRRSAQTRLAQHLAWEERVLVPWGLGIGHAEPAPVDLDGVDARASALRRGSWLLSGEERQRAEQAGVRLAALARRLGRGELAVREREAARDPATQVVDAFLLAERDEPRRALQRLATVDPTFPPGRRLALLLRARVGTRAERLRALEEPEGDPLSESLRKRLAREVLGEALGEVLERAAGDARADAELAGLMVRARRLGLEPEELAAAKQRALETSVPRWEQVLRGALGRDEAPDPVERLRALHEAPPPIPVGPRLRAAITTIYEEAMGGALVLQRDTSLRRLATWGEAFYRLDPTAQPESLAEDLELLVGSVDRFRLGMKLPPAFYLAALRLGVPLHRDLGWLSLCEAAPPEELLNAAERVRSGQALRAYLELSLALGAAGLPRKLDGGSLDAQGRERLAELARAVLDAPPAGLGPHHRGETRIILAWLENLPLRGRQGRAPELEARVLELCRAARRELRPGWACFASYVLCDELFRRRGEAGGEERVAVWAEALPLLQEQLRADPTLAGEMVEYALEARARSLLGVGRRAEAVPFLLEAIRLRGPSRREWRLGIVLAHYLEREELVRAEALVREHRVAGYLDPGFGEQAVRLALRRGRLDEARARLARARERSWTPRPELWRALEEAIQASSSPQDADSDEDR